MDAILKRKMNIALRMPIKLDVKAGIPEYRRLMMWICVHHRICWIMPSRKIKGFREKTRFIRIYIAQKIHSFNLALQMLPGEKAAIRAGPVFWSAKGAHHGLVFMRWESLVKKYGGFPVADSEDGGFTAEILIPLMLQKEPLAHFVHEIEFFGARLCAFFMSAVYNKHVPETGIEPSESYLQLTQGRKLERYEQEEKKQKEITENEKTETKEKAPAPIMVFSAWAI